MTASHSLARLFEELYAPLQMRHAAPGYIDIHRCSLAWLDKALGRRALTSDLTPAAIAAALERLAAAGLSVGRLKGIRNCWLRVWTFAAQLGLAAAVDRPPLPQAVGSQRGWAATPPAAGSLLAFYRRTFRPRLTCRPKTVASYDCAINHFCDFAGQVFEEDLTRERVADFRAWLAARGVSARLVMEYATRIGRVGRAIAPERFPARGGAVPKRPIAGGARAPRCRKLPEPQGEPGTLLHFFQTAYRPQALLEASEISRDNYLATFRKLRACFGRELRLDELSASAVATFLAWLQERGASPNGSHRRRLLALWRYANELALAAPVPRMRKARVQREVPDAWSLDELARLIAATPRLEKPAIGGVAAPDYWRALLLVGYWTALRRSSLLRLKPEDLDVNGWLDVPALAMKNGHGQRFRLGQDAIDAVAKILGPRPHIFPKLSDGGALGEHFRALVDLAGLPRSRHKRGLFHKLRRTSITHTAARAGLAAAIALAGHSGPYVTERYLDPRFLTGNDATQWLPRLPDVAA